jgi:hypothetical protein
MSFWMLEQLKHDGIFVDIHDRRIPQRLPILCQAAVEEFVVVDNRAVIGRYTAILIKIIAVMWKLHEEGWVASDWSHVKHHEFASPDAV